jgi:hypothetical protein
MSPWLMTLNRQCRAGLEWPDLQHQGMTESSCCYDVTITADRDGGNHPNPARVRCGGSLPGHMNAYGLHPGCGLDKDPTLSNAHASCGYSITAHRGGRGG